jgi:hypothetical protein
MKNLYKISGFLTYFLIVFLNALNEETCTILVLQYLSLIKPDGENKNTKGNKIKALIMAVKTINSDHIELLFRLF